MTTYTAMIKMLTSLISNSIKRRHKQGVLPIFALEVSFSVYLTLKVQAALKLDGFLASRLCISELASSFKYTRRL